MTTPLVSRQGSKLVGYSHADFAHAKLPSGPSGKQLDASGRLTDIVVYRAPAGKRTTEVFENYRQALAKASFRVQWQCAPGTRAPRMRRLPLRRRRGRSGDRHAQGRQHDDDRSAGGDEQHNVTYMLASLQRNGQTSTVAVLVSQDDDRQASVLLRVVESGG